MNYNYKVLYEDAISQCMGLNAENYELRQTIKELEDELKESKCMLRSYNKAKYIDYGKLTDCIMELCDLTYVTI